MKSVAVTVACLLALVPHAAQAGVAGSEKATELLAHSWVIDNRCGVLNKDERDTLTGLVARAEISLAENNSVKAARDAIARGRASGLVAPCDERSARTVKETLQAAMSATSFGQMDVSAKLFEVQPVEPATNESVGDVAPAVEPSQDSEPIIAEQEAIDPPVVVRKPTALESKPVRIALKQEKPVVLVTAPKSAVVGGSYASTAENYYRELRCRRLSPRAINAMYARVLREHRQAVAASGKAAVRKLLRAAEARSADGSC